VTDAVFDRTGLRSIDSEFALEYLSGGLLVLLAFALVVLGVVRVAVRRGLSPVERAWAVGMVATSANLLTVALLTQQAELFWAWTALLAGLEQRQALRRPAASREQVPA
jgi:hypothetical protein